MEQILFYCVSIIIPTIVILFSLGHTVYVIGEYKETLLNIPRVLLILMSKVICNTILFLFVLLYVFDDFRIVGMLIPSFLIGVYLLFDLFFINKMLSILTKYCENVNRPDFNFFIIDEITRLFRKNMFWLTTKYILQIGLICGLLYNVIFHYSVFTLVTCVVLIILIYVKILFSRYIKSFNN